jgi:3-oxoacyl-[acyl-carrier-protein] synthase II
MLTGIHGDGLTLGTACTASLQAIGEAFRRICTGYLDTALAGGGDSRLNPGGILAYKKAQALFRPSGDPGKEYAPFDERRNGFVPGEGGAFFLLEDLKHAEKREAPIYGEICGYGSALDGHGMTAPSPDGQWPEKAVRSALTEAEQTPDTIDLVSAHGTGTVLNDEMEAKLIHRLYTRSTPHVIALKSWIGHAAAACGAVELAVLLAALKARRVPEIRNLARPCHDGVRFVREPLSSSPNWFMVQNFGFGGQNSALVVRNWKGR